jgi:hypothetical protein
MTELDPQKSDIGKLKSIFQNLTNTIPIDSRFNLSDNT